MESEAGGRNGSSQQKVTGPRIDGRRSPSPSDSEASDDEVSAFEVGRALAFSG
jgi:hypothetical protein